MVSHAGAPVDTRGLSMCETCTKQVSIPAFEREKIMSSAWNSARQLDDTSKQCFILLFLDSIICLLSIPFCIHIGEKRIGTSVDTRNPTPPKDGELSTKPEDVDAEVQEVVEMGTTTGDVDVVEEETHFSSASAQILIREIMICNRDLEKVKQNIHEVQKRLSNIIDIISYIISLQ
ncbi:hypothetical protein AB205_0104790 [Aquarana catesbeiana]|uniref:Uncharacterized protein n=2 Tax=Aquarana catesbeiana TaxID=8400 RepID=A0A2G9RDF0_AQUCT|nr:hypothetical protein AB205_0104790 [Aquarana catesbeiana]